MYTPKNMKPNIDMKNTNVYFVKTMSIMCSLYVTLNIDMKVDELLYNKQFYTAGNIVINSKMVDSSIVKASLEYPEDDKGPNMAITINTK